MKNILITSGLFLLAILFSCSEKVHDYHAGIIVDQSGKPLDSVLVYENLAKDYQLKTYTDSTGYFKQKRQALMDLIVTKHGYLTDTIKMVWHQAGETTEYSPIITKDNAKIILKADTTVVKANIVLGFYSVCCGTPKGDEILNYIKEFVQYHDLNSVKITRVGGLGKEGEHDFLLEFAVITKAQKVTLINNLIKLAKMAHTSNSSGGINVIEINSFETRYPNKERLIFTPIKL